LLYVLRVFLNTVLYWPYASCSMLRPLDFSFFGSCIALQFEILADFHMLYSTRTIVIHMYKAKTVMSG